MNVDDFNRLTERSMVDEPFFEHYILPFYRYLCIMREDDKDYPQKKFVRWYDRCNMNRVCCSAASDFSKVNDYLVEQNKILQFRVEQLQRAVEDGVIAGKIIIKPDLN